MRKILSWKRISIMLLSVILVCTFLPSNVVGVKAANSINFKDEAYNIDNFSFSFQTIDGMSVSTVAEGRPKILMFYGADNQASGLTIQEMCRFCDECDVDIVTIEIDGATKEEVEVCKEANAKGNESINFCYSESRYINYAWKYYYACLPGGYGFSDPLTIFIDANNKIQFATSWWVSAPEMLDILNNYCNANFDFSVAAEIYKVVNVVSGVHLYWNAKEDAEAYSVWRKESGTDQESQSIVITKATHYIDTTAESGKTYEYQIYKVFYDRDDWEEYYEPSKVVTVTYVDTPDITSRANSVYGVRLGWNKISGATGYAIYRKPYDGDTWVRVTTIKGNSTFTWTDPSVKTNNGTIYKYTIRALAGNKRNILSGCRTTGRTMTRLTSRTLNSAIKASATSIKCNWTTTSVCNGYEVRFIVGSTVYKTYTVGNYKTGVKTFTGLKAGQTYKVQVRSYKKVAGVGTFYSAWSTEKMVTL